MGEFKDRDEFDVNEHSRALTEQAEKFGLPQTVTPGEPYADPQNAAPLIVDIDPGDNPADAIALAAAANHSMLALVTMTNELNGEYAQFVWHLFTLLGRPEVPVVIGSECVDAVARVCKRAKGAVRWAGLGSFATLTTILAARPDLAAQLTVTQISGKLLDRNLSAAALVLTTLQRPKLLMPEVIDAAQIEIQQDSALYHCLAEPLVPAWARLIVEQLDRWFTQNRGNAQYSALVLGAALQFPFIGFGAESVTINTGTLTLDSDGIQIRINQWVNYPMFMRWLRDQLSEAKARNTFLIVHKCRERS